MAQRQFLVFMFVGLLSVAVGFKSPALAVAALKGKHSRISPPLEGSEKDFFGPPHPSNYQKDKSPKATNLKKDEGKPYPHVQPSPSFDYDYTKDDYEDKGEWKAQLEYDQTRFNATREANEADEAMALAAAAQENADGEEKAFKTASNGFDVAMKEQAVAVSESKTAKTEADVAAASRKTKAQEEASQSAAEELKESNMLKNNLKEAKDNYAKVKTEVERELAVAKTAVDEAQTKADAHKSKNSTNVMVGHFLVHEGWLDAEKAKVDAAAAKEQAANKKVEEAKKVRDAAEKVLAASKVENEQAQQVMKKQVAEKTDIEHKLEAAGSHLRSVRKGAMERDAAPTAGPAQFAVKSGALAASGFAFAQFLVVASLL